MILKKHNVVHYGEVLLLVLQDYQLDNGSRLEKFRGKEGQSDLDRVYKKNPHFLNPLNLFETFPSEARAFF